jgi:hypothetical protein
MKNLGTLYPSFDYLALFDETKALMEEARKNNFPVIRERLGRDKYRYTIEALKVVWVEDMS